MSMIIDGNDDDHKQCFNITIVVFTIIITIIYIVITTIIDSIINNIITIIIIIAASIAIINPSLFCRPIEVAGSSLRRAQSGPLLVGSVSV
ncbi:hypothetical protein ElyMa_000490300 [Elysia marginata]|uniref:Uncharacterized protein n=1 Tax=Elysia marginata TaxID=1093978 RepID=A0AAV4FTX5_9GAST|nr:hypothetical protein ElyMa_000490300 [Elysia marginata]